MSLNFVVSNQTNPYWNVAVENYLVSLPDEGVVYMYLWKNRRTVVIGQNQNPYSECKVEALLADGGYVMRRTTGGGAVYHDDGNINFSFVAPYGLYDQNRQFEVIRRAVQSYGLDAELSGRNDLLCQGRKFSGNAFSKGRQQRLHHGTILIKGNMDDLSHYLKVNPAKLHKHGVASVQSRVVNLSELADVSSDNIVPHLMAAFEEVYGEKAHKVDFSEIIERQEVKSLYERFSSEEWLYGKWRNFTATVTGQFDWGGVELHLDVDQSNGIIREVSIATDSLNVGICDTVKSLLAGASSTQPPVVPEDMADREALNDILTLVY